MVDAQPTWLMIYQKNDVLVEILLIDAEMIVGLWQQDGALLNDGQLVRLKIDSKCQEWRSNHQQS